MTNVTLIGGNVVRHVPVRVPLVCASYARSSAVVRHDMQFTLTITDNIIHIRIDSSPTVRWRDRFGMQVLHAAVEHSQLETEDTRFTTIPMESDPPPGARFRKKKK